MNSYAVVERSANQDQSTSVPAFWRVFLRFVTVGKAAIGGAGFGVALSGLLNLAFVIAASAPRHSDNSYTLEIIAGICGVLGAIISIVTTARVRK